ncbi:MAG TPA: Flp pilus assembly protein CpaB [Vicinamibacterales bacterium]|jgi:pilus assembly protein CpaB
MIALAGLFGLLAVFIANSWLNNQAERMKSREAKQQPTVTQTIVVASKPLRFGNELSKSNLQEIAWPKANLPAGAFTRIDEVLKGGKRVVLAPIEVNEPVLAVKVTGPGQRATLSALVGPGMKAVTIRVNDIEGVGGFVLPGDRVDVVMTRQMDKGAASNEVVLQNVKVLAIDQIADVRTDKPSVAKAVTLEVDTVDAQKVWLAASVGNLSLLLRKAGEVVEEKTRRITLKDLLGDLLPTASAQHQGAKVVVTRGSQKQEYNVPYEGKSDQAMGTVGQSQVR